ncbi:hypothetical protein [Maritimibacter alexandrii]|uniref:hypothetical protein n=1 Tax=Maritimibacter alexandrii TaxID=2570355 RepID=UPI001107F470|nr:hypothetical protein [Maritimibacter alexandrii]
MSEETNFLKCDIEMEVAAPSMKVAENWAAKALRKLADQIEAGETKDGHHDITTSFGRKIGEVYFDFSEGFHIEDDGQY